jgi:phosphate transport system substrate-binding protein
MSFERQNTDSVHMGRRAFMAALGLTVAGVAAAAKSGESEFPVGADPAAVSFVDLLPPYTPRDRVSGVISLWGHGSFKHDFLGSLRAAWIDGFRRIQPEVQFDNRMYGTASAIGALLTGAGNLAILGEEINPAAAAAFHRAKRYPPTGFHVATGSLDVNFFDYAHMIFVHASNPIRRLTVAQLEAVFGTEHELGPDNIRTWDRLGLRADWHARPIQPYSWKIDEDFGLFFREAVLGGSHRWNVDVKEFAHLTRSDGSVYEHGAQILDALAHDRLGIAISNVRYANPNVKSLALASRGGGPYYSASQANLISQNYPLTRVIPAFIDRVPGHPVDPKLREFLCYILSREGQRALLKHSGYLPLGVRAIQQQLEKLA